MKKLIWIVYWTALLVACKGLAFGAEIPYEFSTLDLSIPGHPTMRASPDDLSDGGDFLSSAISIDNLVGPLIVFGQPVNSRNTKFKAPSTVMFNCVGLKFADTVGYSITNDRAVTGGCVDAPSAPSKAFGFVRFQSGSHILLDFPGADGTSAFGRSENGKVVGQFYGPLRNDHGGALSYRFHCFIWDPVTNHYTQLDFPVPNTYVTCPAINKNGQVLVEYITVTLQNEYIEHGWAIYDKGIFTILGLTFEHIGGPWMYFADMNDDTAAVGVKSKNDGTPPQIVFYDDGIFYDVTGMPSSWLLSSVSGMNNKNQFVGLYAVQTGKFDPTGQPIYAFHGFIATPRPLGVSKRGK